MTALTYVSTVTAQGTPTNARTSFAFSLTAGNHVFVQCFWPLNATTVTVTDTAGNTYVPLTLTVHPSGTRRQWFYALNCVGHATNVITATWSGSTPVRELLAVVLAGSTPTTIAEAADGALRSQRVVFGSAFNATQGAMLLLGGGGSNANFAPDAPWTPNTSDTWTNPSGGGGSVDIWYMALPDGAFQMAGPEFMPLPQVLSYHNEGILLRVENGGAAAVVPGNASKLGGYALLGAVPDGATVSKLTAYAVMDDPPFARVSQLAVEVLSTSATSGGYANVGQVAVEVLSQTSFGPNDASVGQLAIEVINRSVSDIINDRDKLLQATSPRYT